MKSAIALRRTHRSRTKTLELRFEGVNGGTSLAETAKWRSLLTNFSITTSTAQKFEGGSSGEQASGSGMAYGDQLEGMRFYDRGFRIVHRIRLANVSGTKMLQTNRATTGADSGYLLWIVGTQVRFLAWGPTPGITMVDIIGGTVAANTWHTIEVTRVGNLWSILVDGVSVASATVPGMMAHSPNAWRIGHDPSASGREFVGFHDLVEIYKDVEDAIPRDPYTVSYVHFNGAHNSTVFLDKYDNGWAAGNDAKLNTQLSKFRAASGRFDGTLDRIYGPIYPRLQFLDTTEVTLEGWFNIAGNSIVEGGSAGACIWAANIPASGTFVDAAVVSILGNSTTTGTGLALEYWNGAGSTTNVYANMTITQGVWHFFQFRRSTAGVWTIWLDGTSYTLANNTLGATVASFGTSGEVSIGATTNAVYKRQFNGYFSELRISKGVSRPTAMPTDVLEYIPGDEIVVTAWDPVQTGPNIRLSNGKLLASKAVNDVYASVKSNTSKTTGKWYAEFVVGGNPSAPYQHVGVATAAATITNYFCSQATGWGYYQETGQKFNNAVGTAFGAAYSAAIVIGVAVDVALGRVWFSRQGVWQGSGDPANNLNPAFTGLAGPIFLAAAIRTSSLAGVDSATLRPTAALQTYAPPAGFTAWG